jgi:hypothetical protein
MISLRDEEANALLEPTFPFGTGKRTDQVSERREEHALSGFHGFDAQRCGTMALSRSRWAEEMNRLVTVDEPELRQAENAIPIERGLEGRVETGKGLDRRQPAHPQGGLDAAVLA